MRETRTSGSVGAPGEQSPGATWPREAGKPRADARRALERRSGGFGTRAAHAPQQAAGLFVEGGRPPPGACAVNGA